MSEHTATLTTEPLLTITDVAAVLRVSRGSVYGLVRRRDLAAIRVGERLRFENQEVAAFLARARENAAETLNDDGSGATEPLASTPADEAREHDTG